MTINDALLAMARIDGLHDGTPERTMVAEALHRKLIEYPETFWDEFFAVVNPPREEALNQLGQLGIDATFSDLWTNREVA